MRFRAVNLSSYNGWLEKRQNTDLTFLKFIPEAGITFLFVNIVHVVEHLSAGRKDQSVCQLLKSKIKPQMAHAHKLIDLN